MKILQYTVYAFLLFMLTGTAYSMNYQVDWIKRVDVQNSGQDEAWHIHQLSNNTYILTGMSTSYELTGGSGSIGKRTFFMRLDENGNLIGEKKYLDTLNICDKQTYHGYEFHPIRFAPDSFIFAGHRTDIDPINDSYYYKALLVKLDENLNSVWEKEYGTPENQMLFFSVQPYIEPNGDSGYVAVGCKRTTNYNSSDILIMKVDKNGDSLWTRTYDLESSVDIAKSVKVITNSNNEALEFVAAGYSKHESSSRHDFDATIVKVDVNNNLLLATTYDDGQHLGEMLEDMKIAGHGTNSEIYCSGGNGEYATLDVALKPFVIKFAYDGQVSWKQDFNISINGVSHSLIKVNNEVVIAGVQLNPSPYPWTNIYLADVNITNGSINWGKDLVDDDQAPAQYRCDKGDYGYWIQPTSDGGFVVTGTTLSLGANFGDSSDVFVMKLSPLQYNCGDVNSDGSIDISDVVFFVDYMFNNGPPPPNPVTADLDGHWGITISDLNYFIDYTTNQPPGPAPVCNWLFGPE